MTSEDDGGLHCGAAFQNDVARVLRKVRFRVEVLSI